MEIFFEQKNFREKTFIFTLDANEEVGETGDNYMNCMCVPFEEILMRQSDKQIFVVQKCFCFMFMNNYFQSHIEILSGLLQSIKGEIFDLQTGQ